MFIDANLIESPTLADVINVCESRFTYNPIQNFPFILSTGDGLVTHPVDELIGKATQHTSNLAFLEVDDELDVKLDSYVSKINEGAVVKKVRRKVQL